MPWESFAGHWSSILSDVGIIAGLFFSGLGFWRDARVRRAQTLLEITKLHRELWSRFDERPELAGLFDKSRDLVARPMTSEEVRFANFLFLHIRAAYHAEKAKIYSQPDRLKEDLREIFSYPGPRSAWAKLRPFHDRDFVAFLEKNLGA